MDFLTLISIKCVSPKIKWFISVIIASLVISCGTTKQNQNLTKTDNQQSQLIEPTRFESAEKTLKSALKQKPAQASGTLLLAAQLFLQENKAEQAKHIAIESQQLNIKDKQRYQFALILAQSYLMLSQDKQADAALTIADQLQSQAELTHKAIYYQTLAKLKQRQGQVIESITAQLHALALTSEKVVENTSEKTPTAIENFWHQLSQLSYWQYQQLKSQNAPELKGWLALLNICYQFADHDDRFRRYLEQWRRQYSQHSAMIITDSLLKLPELTNQPLENVAIILPLSGKQQRAGLALQQGILAAYQSNADITLHFIDAMTLDINSLPERFTQLDIDHVIGPLLKKNVEQYLALEALTIPTLLLNVTNNMPLKTHQVALSMRPEDEAIQAATTLSNKGYQQPIVLSQKDKTSKRITQTFVKQWQKINGKAPEIYYFDKGANMQKQLKASLGVDASEARIKAIDSRIKHTIKSEKRNRRDVDMIYIVGKALETKLLKPYIDVNTSPFADVIPVYASSRSHNTKADKGDMRDLSRLIFSDIPWKIPSKQQNKALTQISKQLWPNRSDSLETFFAMGYDGFSLLKKLSAMQQRPIIKHFGQTGVLTLNNKNILTRSLLWGKYSQQGVKETKINE